MDRRSDTGPFADEIIVRVTGEPTSGETSEATEAAIRASTPKNRPPKRLKPRRIPRFVIPEILVWAAAHRERSGSWPTKTSGRIPEAPTESWNKVDLALRTGLRGLPGGATLARLLFEHLGANTRASLILYTLDTICEWAKAWQSRSGDPPDLLSGDIPEAPGETWCKVNEALKRGGRGLPGGSSLSRLLAERLGVQNRWSIGTYTEGRILEWADQYQWKHGRLPTQLSGAIANSGGATWMSVNMALVQGGRGLPGGSSLGRLLAERRGAPYQPDLPRFSKEAILQWADAHQERSGQWPTRSSGPIPEAPGENWRKVDAALRVGNRGCPGGSSLARLLAEQRGVRNRVDVPRLTIPGILGWANAYRMRTGSLPTRRSGSVAESPGDTWSVLDVALKQGLRGLPGGITLARLLREIHTRG